MKAKATEAGRVVVVTKGHDAGNWCVVLRVLDERTVLLCDGRLRTLEKPKKKQGKHLRALPLSIPVEGKGASGGPISDSDIRKALSAAKDATITQCGSDTAIVEKKEECAFVQKRRH